MEMKSSSAGVHVLRIDVRYDRLMGDGLEERMLLLREVGPGDGTGVGGEAMGM